MEVPVRLAKSGDMTDGTVLAWHVEVGTRVTKGQPIVEVEMAKATLEIEAPASGVLTQIAVEVDETVDVGEILAIIASDEQG